MTDTLSAEKVAELVERLRSGDLTRLTETADALAALQERVAELEDLGKLRKEGLI